MPSQERSDTQDGQIPSAETALPVQFLAGPARPSPPMPVALAIVIASLFAPILFMTAGVANPLLGISILALWAAGIIAVLGVLNGRRRLRDDPEIRVRAEIGVEGITLFKAPFPSTGQFFPVSQIAKARFFDNSLVVLTTGTHPAPGRYALRYGKAITGRDRITAALTALIEPS